MLQVAQQLYQNVLGVHELAIDVRFLLLQEAALLRYLSVYGLEVVENGEILEVEDDLAQGLGGLDDAGRSDLYLERLHFRLAGLVGRRDLVMGLARTDQQEET